MIRFDPYPITINGSLVDEAVRGIAERAAKAGEFDDATRLRILRESNAFDYIPDSSPEAARYEERVRALLNGISCTEIGRCLLNFLKGGLPLWIIPYDTRQRDVFGRCNSNTGHSAPQHAGGHAVRIAYSPDLFTFSDCGWYPGMRADEVLFHELVHAYRYASPMIPQLNNDPLPDNQDHEEFLANQVTNVYRSMNGARKFNRDYVSKLLASAAECEEAIWSRGPLLAALDAFLHSDPLVTAIAKIKTLYNPFRDIDRLKQARIDSMGGGVRIHGGHRIPRPLP